MGSFLSTKLEEGHLKAFELVAMMFLWIIPLLIFSSCATQNQGKTPSWVDICGGVFLFSEDTQQWKEAYGQCELYGSHIVQIDNLVKNFCLLDHAHKMGYDYDYWHSANDIESEGVWRQWNGTLLSWTPWWAQIVYSEPNGGEAENCGGVSLRVGEWAGKWWSNPCSEGYRYICEKTL